MPDLGDATIRLMARADLAAVLAIEAACYPDPWSQQTFEDCLSAQAKGYGCYALLLNDTIVGYAVATVVVDQAELLNFCLAPQIQGQGRAIVYLQKLLDRLVAQGAAQLFLEVRQSNVPARRLYAAAGLSEVGVRKDYYPAHPGREDAILMAATL